MADTPKTKQRPTGERMGIRRRLRAELSFSWESLRLNGRGLIFALLTGLVVGLCGGAFVYLLGLAERLRNETEWAALLFPIVGCSSSGSTKRAASAPPEARISSFRPPEGNSPFPVCWLR